MVVLAKPMFIQYYKQKLQQIILQTYATIRLKVQNTIPTSYMITNVTKK